MRISNADLITPEAQARLYATWLTKNNKATPHLFLLNYKGHDVNRIVEKFISQPQRLRTIYHEKRT